MKNELDKLTTVVVSDDDRQLNDILFDLGVISEAKSSKVFFVQTFSGPRFENRSILLRVRFFLGRWEPRH